MVGRYHIYDMYNTKNSGSHRAMAAVNVVTESVRESVSSDDGEYDAIGCATSLQTHLVSKVENGLWSLCKWKELRQSNC